MFEHIIGCIFRILISITVEKRFCRKTMMAGWRWCRWWHQQWQGRLWPLAIDSGNDDIKNDREKETYPERWKQLTMDMMATQMMTALMIMMMLRKSILVSPWQASPGAVNLLRVHYNVFQHTDDEQCHNFFTFEFYVDTCKWWIWMKVEKTMRLLNILWIRPKEMIWWDYLTS